MLSVVAISWFGSDRSSSVYSPRTVQVEKLVVPSFYAYTSIVSYYILTFPLQQ